MGDCRRDGRELFERLGLAPEVVRAVADLGYGRPTPVQEEVMPCVLQGRDVLVRAQTGTGKTASYLLPALSRLGSFSRPKTPIMLVLVPTRELAMQVADVARAVGGQTGHVTATAVGGVGYQAQRRSLADGCDVLVCTPGRLLDLVEQACCDLGGVEMLVIDEADRMLDMGFLPDVQKVVARVPSKRQTLLFSATLNGGVPESLLSSLRDPVCIEVSPAGSVAELVDHYVLFVPAEEKKRVLVEVLRREGPRRVLVFVRGKRRADHLCRILQHKGFACDAIHGDRTQRQRSLALGRFARGEVDVLVATDVLARGIDIEGVSYVVNADVPHEVENYVHRVGRAGRAGRNGWALTLCSPGERRDLLAIQRYVGKSIAVYRRMGAGDCGEPARGLAGEGEHAASRHACR